MSKILNTLTPAQNKALTALASGSTVLAAAEAAGVTRATIYNWLNLVPHFRAAVRNSAAQHAEALRDDLRALSQSAIAVIASIMTNETNPAALRLRAAIHVIKAVEATHPDHAVAKVRDFEQLMNAAINRAGEQAALAQTVTQQPNLTEFDTSKPPATAEPPTPRNAQCPCGSGDKYKRCHGPAAPPVIQNLTPSKSAAEMI